MGLGGGGNSVDGPHAGGALGGSRSCQKPQEALRPSADHWVAVRSGKPVRGCRLRGALSSHCMPRGLLSFPLTSEGLPGAPQRGKRSSPAHGE